MLPSLGPAVAAATETFGILSRGEVSEWLMVPLSKSGVRKHRGFESRPLRHYACRVYADGSAFASTPTRRAEGQSGFAAERRRQSLLFSRGRGRLVDYGAALEMRFGATRRGFESRPLRQSLPAGTPRRALASAVLAPRANGVQELRLGPRWANIHLATEVAGAPVLGRRLRLDAHSASDRPSSGPCQPG
jgi:hypothetical protein